MAEDTSTVAVNYFAALVDAVGCEREQFTLADPTVGGLRRAIGWRHGDRAGELAAHCSVLDGDRLLRADTEVIGSQVDVLPPFAGG
ncbi:molybdopterin synthase small subunit MoaD [Gordonia hirsuta DSM 44140 = NBRC 16056]|uniref:Molybdopterin synthase small subunit MoaD n=1 Tax=Gordonia hirsuta DSM 44140 = NBRC 16056 TaxID=1121927 RepID=L7L9K2_9ACTN|nr:MoaD/ThiS family protein [Gordonia hirsuta]GAC57589.1 molybdopterin synthase small subunit MoaD [Gordonia hirsuta DSM 44140 = NBRC 16056]